MSFTSVYLSLRPPGGGKHTSLLLTPYACAPLFAPCCRNSRLLLMDTEAASFFLHKNGCAEVGAPEYRAVFQTRHPPVLWTSLHRD